MAQLVEVFEWNTNGEGYYNDTIELKLMGIFNNLIESTPFDHGKPLIDGGYQWVLNRVAGHFFNTNPSFRKEVIVIFGALLKYHQEEYKKFLIENYDLVKILLELLKRESSIFNINLTLNLIELCLLKEWSPELDLESYEVDKTNVNFLNL